MSKKKHQEFIVQIERPVVGYREYLNFDSYSISFEGRNAVFSMGCSSGASVGRTVIVDMFDIHRVKDSFGDYLTRMENVSPDQQSSVPKRFDSEESFFANHVTMGYSNELAEIAFLNFSICDLTMDSQPGDTKDVKPDGALLARSSVGLHKAFLIDLLSLPEFSP